MTRSHEEILDELLILQSQGGDPSAWRQLVERWHSRLLAHALRLLGRPDAAADVTQDAWMAMVRGIRSLEDPAKFRPWAYRILGNKATDYLRRRQLERHGLGHQQELDSHVPQAPGQTDVVQQQRQSLRAAIRQLPPEKRHLISMFYLEQMPLADIAEALGVPLGTIKSRLHTIRAELKRQVQELSHARDG